MVGGGTPFSHLSKTLYPIGNIMRKKNLARSIVLYIVFLSNTVYCVKHGFSWPYWITAILTLAVLILDIVEVVKRGKH